MGGKRCIDCGAPISADARKLNPSELWCVEHEAERRRRITASMADITASFAQLHSREGKK
jgi:hypothetical protein